MATNRSPELKELGSDGELMAMRSGDRVATEQFVRGHGGWMLAVAQRILRDAGLAEDAVQNAFANVFKSH